MRIFCAVRYWKEPVRRWTLTALMFFGWCGIVPLLVVAAYYGLTSHTDFDPALDQMRNGNVPAVWLLRIGTASSYDGMVGTVSSHFGLNAEFESKTHPGVKVVGQYRATYLAKLRGTAFPVVMTACRDVASDGQVFYDVQNHGFRPIRSYLNFMVAASLGSVVFFELVAAKQKKAETLRASSS